MRKLTYFVASTLDGFIAGPDGSWDFFPIEGPHMVDVMERFPETVPTHVRKMIGIAPENINWDTVLMGRATYDPALKEGVTSPFGHLRQLVFSRSLNESPDPAVEIVTGDPVATVRELKSAPGLGIWLSGGGQLAHQLLPELDELTIKLYPIVIGSGIPLFAGGFGVHHFDLVDSRTYANGVMLLSYVRRS
jgi:dihydrofolate reductase